MEQESRCFFCGDKLTKENYTLEHIIPNAIGGRKKVDNFICRKCNNEYGETWDNALTEQFKELCFFLNIKRERGEVQPLTVTDINNKKYKLSSEHILTGCKPEIEERVITDNHLVTTCSVNNLNELKQIKKGIIRKYKNQHYSKIEISEPKEKILSVPINSTFEKELGGIDMFKSLAKTCLALAIKNKFNDNFEDINNVLFKNNELLLCGFCQQDYVLNRNKYNFFHCVYIKGYSKIKKIVGYVEYFSAIQVIIVLSNHYQGPDKEAIYAMNPITGEDLPLSVFIPEDKIEYTADFDNIKFEKAIQESFKYYNGIFLKKELNTIFEKCYNNFLKEYSFNGEDIPLDIKNSYKLVCLQAILTFLNNMLKNETNVSKELLEAIYLEYVNRINKIIKKEE